MRLYDKGFGGFLLACCVEIICHGGQDFLESWIVVLAGILNWFGSSILYMVVDMPMVYE